jgi:hypothetical protein
MMASVRPRLLKTPAEPSPELRISAAAAQTRVVSLAGIRLGSWESARAFKGIVCDDISEFESYMPSHAVGLSQVRSPAIVMHRVALDYDVSGPHSQTARHPIRSRSKE